MRINKEFSVIYYSHADNNNAFLKLSSKTLTKAKKEATSYFPNHEVLTILNGENTTLSTFTKGMWKDE